MGCHQSFCFWIRIAPSLIPDPLVSTQNGLSGVGMANAGAVVIAVLRVSKAFWQSSSHMKSFFSDVSAFKGHTTWAKFRMKYQ